MRKHYSSGNFLLNLNLKKKENQRVQYDLTWLFDMRLKEWKSFTTRINIINISIGLSQCGQERDTALAGKFNMNDEENI